MSLPMQAVILAAGRGSRMGPSTEERPKCMHPLAGRPILDWTLRALRIQGIERVLLIGGWHAEALRFCGAELRINQRWQTTNMVRSLELAADWLQAAPTLVVYGDGAYGPRALEKALTPSRHDLLVPIDSLWLDLWRRRFQDPLADAETLRLDGGFILAIGQRPSNMDEVQGQFMGLLRTTPAGWRHVALHLQRLCVNLGDSAVDRLDMTGLLSSLLAHGIQLRSIEVSGGWVEIDSENDVAVVEQALYEPEFSHDFRN